MSLSRKRRGIAAGVVVALVAAAAAYAYWTAGGSGTGTAATGTSTALTANQTATLTPMFPGDSQQTIAGDFTNTNSGPVYVTSVTVAIDTVTGGAGSCDASDYLLTAPTMNVGHQVAVGTHVDAFSGAKIQFNNKASNQDGCKGATVNLKYTIN